MILTNKLLPVALVAALIGGSVGAFVMHSNNASAETQRSTLDTSRNPDVQYARYQAAVSGSEQIAPVEFNTSAEQTAYKSGFADGFRACESGASGNQLSSRSTVSRSTGYSQPRVVYRNTGRSDARTSSNSRRVSTSSNSQRVYYDHQQPKKRSFWSKHRDKLTVAMGAGGGAALGGLFGGKKGAAIGALAGGGGSALYTYKLRNRNRRY
ncbi:MAG: hypothetical protein ACR2HX_04605 [Pyrinomonadaceae bacterium]